MSNLRQKVPLTRKIRYIESNNGEIVPAVSGTLFTRGQRNILQKYADQYRSENPVQQEATQEVAQEATQDSSQFWKGWTGNTKTLFTPMPTRKQRKQRNNKKNQRKQRSQRKTRKL
jgi:hypothetical protein